MLKLQAEAMQNFKDLDNKCEEIDISKIISKLNIDLDADFSLTYFSLEKSSFTKFSSRTTVARKRRPRTK